jgi:CsoR family transcriptional regulator, copper-sensing transcriptional repressor
VSTISLDTSATDPADRLAARLSGPVLVAALASIPATFLTLLDGTSATVGSTLNALSGAVLVAETLVLFAVAEDRRAWLRRNRWLVGLTVAIVPAVVFAVGPVQLLRLARVVGALRILRVRRILKAGRIIRERYGFTTGWERAVTLVLTLATAAFVAIVLADPTSRSRQLLDGATGRFGLFAVFVAGALIGVATFVVRSNRKRLPARQASDSRCVPDGPG